MKTIQASQAKAQFLGLLDAVERGETFIVTRHGKPVARIGPENTDRSARMKAALDDLEKFRKTLPRISLQDILADLREDRDR